MKQKGFTLIELMIVVAIIGILTAIAYPNFTAYMTKAKRSDAKSALMGLQQAQAKVRAGCRFYAGSLDTTVPTTPPPCTTANGINSSADVTLNYPETSDEGYYALTLTDVTASAYKATATAITDAGQTGDTGCTILELTVSAANPRGLREPTTCW